MATGIHGSIGPFSPMPMMLPAQPHWNTATITPYAAPTLSRFMITALSGRTNERKTTMSNRKDRISTAPITMKRRWPRKLAASIDAAVSPRPAR